MPVRIAAAMMILTLGMLVGCRGGREDETQTANAAEGATPAFTEVPKPEEVFAVTIWPQTYPTSPQASAEGPPSTRHVIGNVKPTPEDCWMGPSLFYDHFFNEWRPTPPDVLAMLGQWKISRIGWGHLSQPLGGDRMGWLILKDGRCIQWMMRPGGMGWLRASTGEMIYLARSHR